MRINKHDTNGTKPLLGKGELGYDDYTAGGDTGRVYVGNGASNIALAKKSEVDAKVVANAGITAGTATKVTYDAKGLVTSGTTLSAGDIPALDAMAITTGTLPVARGGTGTTISTGTGSVVLSTSPVLVTPTIGVATGTSFNSITGLSNTAALAAGIAAIGTDTLVARQDHVHPVQTTISGNAGTATKLQTARTINGVAFDGTANITVDVSDSTSVKLTGNQTIADVKTFTSFPVTPSLAPTTDYEVVNKQYVDRLNKISNSGTVDFNTITSEGLYPSVVLGSSANGMMTPNNYYYVVVYKYNVNTLTQVAYPYSTGNENKEVWTRTQYIGTWGRWTKVGGGHIAQVNTISNPSKAVGATWGKISFSNNEIVTNSNEITYLAGLSNNFYLNSSGEYDFNIQIYVEPPLSGTNISVYLGLFDLGSDGLSDVLIGVASQNIIPGQHPSLNLSKIVKVTTSSRYYTVKWYFLDGNGIQTTLNLQTGSIYCWANCKRI